MDGERCAEKLVERYVLRRGWYFFFTLI
jgi:hypothetical protein